MITRRSSSMPISRRDFVAGLASAAVLLPRVAAAEPRELTAAIIGHTGAGNYGHGLDLVFQGLPGVRAAAVADPDAAGLAKAKERIGVAKAYRDYREMLAAERPNLVSVSPRWSEHHFEMIQAALESGAHVFSEKPFTPTLRESDQLLALAARKKLKIAVAHQMRLAPNVKKLHEEFNQGLLGDLVQMRAFGKQDARAGGEDMLVLGTHLFDMMRLFAGDPRRCSATIWNQGKLARLEDRRNVAEKIGPVLGDEIEAQFEFDRAVVGSFTSRAKLRESVGRWRLELIGARATAVILMDIDPDVYLLKKGALEAGGGRDSWTPFAPIPANEKGTGAANRRVALDWLGAIEHDREPVCSGANAAQAVEMVMSVYEAHLQGRRVELPLSRRDHPLENRI